jgi:hypothetical protein
VRHPQQISLHHLSQADVKSGSKSISDQTPLEAAAAYRDHGVALSMVRILVAKGEQPSTGALEAAKAAGNADVEAYLRECM